MTINQLIKELREYPGNWEVWLEVRGQEAIAKDVDMQSGGAETWVTITDYPSKTD